MPNLDFAEALIFLRLLRDIQMLACCLHLQVTQAQLRLPSLAPPLLLSQSAGYLTAESTKVTRVQAQDEAAGRITRLGPFIAQADFFYKFFIC